MPFQTFEMWGLGAENCSLRNLADSVFPVSDLAGYIHIRNRCCDLEPEEKRSRACHHVWTDLVMVCQCLHVFFANPQ